MIAGILAVDPQLALVGLAGAPLLPRASAAGLRVIAEAFADRTYMPDGQLVARRNAGAVLHDPDQVAERMLSLVTTGRVRSDRMSLIGSWRHWKGDGDLGCRTCAGHFPLVESAITADMARASCVRRWSKIISAKGRFGGLCTGYGCSAALTPCN